MQKNKKIFEKYIENNFKDRFTSVMEKFELYHNLLTEENQKINLVSRKTLDDNYWNLHYLDSILLSEIYNLDGKNVLDFGTGGGLPGIPLKIIFQKMKITFLDSRTKKINSIESFIENLEFDGCFFSNKRLEEFNLNDNSSRFDYIICRSVKMNETLKKNLFKLIKDKGKIILYKSINIDDLKIFKNYLIHDVSRPEIGKRLLVEIKKI